MITIDILQLVDRLEEMLDRGLRVPMANRVLVDAGLFSNLVDQMRITIPQEVQRAREIVRDRDRILAQAQEEAAQIIAQAGENAAHQMDEYRLRSAAEAEAQTILRDAKRQAEQMRAAAEQYTEDELRTLGKHVAELMSTIRNGLEMLEKRRAATQAAANAAPVAAQEAPAEAVPAPQGAAEGRH